MLGNWHVYNVCISKHTVHPYSKRLRLKCNKSVPIHWDLPCRKELKFGLSGPGEKLHCQAKLDTKQGKHISYDSIYLTKALRHCWAENNVRVYFDRLMNRLLQTNRLGLNLNVQYNSKFFPEYAIVYERICLYEASLPV